MRLINWEGLHEKGIDYSKPHLWRLIKAGKFPAPVKIGAKNAWPESEIDQLIEDRIAARDQAERVKWIVPSSDTTTAAVAVSNERPPIETAFAGRQTNTQSRVEHQASTDKAGTPLQVNAETAAILTSLLLQHGVDPDVIRHSVNGPIAVALDHFMKVEALWWGPIKLVLRSKVAAMVLAGSFAAQFHRTAKVAAIIRRR
jgi:prophage regulatory protein